MTSKVKVKLCGFSEPQSLTCAIEQKADFVGFIFHEKSPRNITAEKARELGRLVPSHIPKVAVFQNPTLDDLHKAAQSLEPQYFQLHGSQSKQAIQEIKRLFPQIKLIKAFNVAQKSDLEQSIDFIDAADIFLFDGQISGGGKVFDWNFFSDFKSKKPWFLSGGLNCDNILQALKITGAQMVDVSSGIEKIRGVKSPELITEFMTKIKNAG